MKRTKASGVLARFLLVYCAFSICINVGAALVIWALIATGHGTLAHYLVH